MSLNNRVLIIDEMYEDIVPQLENIGLVPSYEPSISRERILQVIGEYAGLIVRSKTSVDSEIIDAGRGLKFVARAGAGLDKVDAEYLAEKGIAMLNAPEGNRDAVGEHALGLLLNLLHKISRGDNEISKGQWNREANRGIELKGKVVGIFGFGNTGEAFARKLSGLECEVIAYDKYKKNFDGPYASEVSLDEFKKRTQFLSIHVPLADDTKGLFDKEMLAGFPQLRIILNTARGEVLITKDALDMMEKGDLTGMGLDVLENERLDQLSPEEQTLMERLNSHPAVLLTPHVAGWTAESYRRINEVLVDKIRNLGISG